MRLRLHQINRRRLQTSSQNSYAILKQLMSSYKSNNRFSNEYKMNTFTNFSKVNNMTSDDDYFSSNIQTICFLIIVFLHLI